MAHKPKESEKDLALIRRVIAREPGADEEFVKRYKRLILHIALKHRRTDQAEDILQTTIARLWANDLAALRAWRGEGEFKYYLGTIVTRICYSYDGRWPLDESLSGEDPLDPAPAPAADELVLDQEHGEAVATCMGALSTRDQLILRLHVDGREPKEIAVIVGLQQGAARKALHDSKKRLKSCIERILGLPG